MDILPERANMVNVVAIRPYTEADAEQLQQAADHVAIAVNLRQGFPSPYSLDDARAWINYVTTSSSLERRSFAITLDGTIVGGIGFLGEPSPDTEAISRSVAMVSEGDTAEFGYWLHPEHWSKGFATEAVRLLLQGLSNGLVRPFAEEIDQIVALVSCSNMGSRRVLEKNGFQATDLVIQSLTQGGEVTSIVYKHDMISIYK